MTLLEINTGIFIQKQITALVDTQKLNQAFP